MTNFDGAGLVRVLELCGASFLSAGLRVGSRRCERKKALTSRVPLATDGQADPLGFEAGLGDDEEPAEGLGADIALRSHFRVNGGEPIGDAAMRGWQMRNGVDFEGSNTLLPNEED